LVESSYFFILYVHSKLQLGGLLRNIATRFGMEKARTMWLYNGEKSWKICLLIPTQYTNVTDGRTDGQTDRHRTTA